MVVQLELDIRQRQEAQQCWRLPTSDEDGVLFKRISEYCEKEKNVRCRSMKAAFPCDVDNIKELKLDCLEASGDAESGIKWRSDTERNLMQSIPGWRDGSISKATFVPLKATFVPLSAILFGAGASVGTVCYITVAAMTTSAREWRAAREEDIRRAYADRECWNDLDRSTWQHPYSFESIEQWPLDAAVICNANLRIERQCCLGASKRRVALEDILKTLLVKVTVVVTMCAHEMKIQGAPKDWTRYFQQEKVFHIKCQLEDTTLKPPQRWDERIPDLVASCLEQW